MSDPTLPYTGQEKAKITAGAAAALMATALLFMIVLGLLLAM